MPINWEDFEPADAPKGTATLEEPKLPQINWDEFEPVKAPTTAEGMPKFAPSKKIAPPSPEELAGAGAESPLAAAGISPIEYLPPKAREIGEKIIGTLGGGAIGAAAEAVSAIAPKTRVGQIAKGIEETQTQNALFFTSPLGVSTLGMGAIPKTAQRLVSLGFAAQMASQTPELSKQLGEELAQPEDKRDYQKISKIVSEAATTLGFTAAGAVHGLAPERPMVLPPRPPIEPPPGVPAPMRPPPLPGPGGVVPIGRPDLPPVQPPPVRTVPIQKSLFPETPTEREVPSAIQKREAETPIPSVQTQPELRAGEVPTEKGDRGIRAGGEEEERQAAREVLLKPVKGAEGQKGTVLLPADAMASLEPKTMQDMTAMHGDFVGGGTGWAWQVGMKTRTQADLEVLKSAYEKYTQMGRQNPQQAMLWMQKGALANEAYQAATGYQLELDKTTGKIKREFPVPDKTEMIRKRFPEHEPPMSPEKVAANLRPSVDLPSGERAVAGPSEVTHGDVLKKAGVEPESIPHEDPARAFTDVRTGERLTRKQAEKATGIEGTAKAGGLDSQDLPRAEAGPTAPLPFKTKELADRAERVRLVENLADLGPETESTRWDAIENTYKLAKAAMEALPGADLKDAMMVVIHEKTGKIPSKEKIVDVRFSLRKDLPKLLSDLDKEYPAKSFGANVQPGLAPYRPRKGEPSFKEWMQGKRPAGAPEAPPQAPPVPTKAGEPVWMGHPISLWKELARPERIKLMSEHNRKALASQLKVNMSGPPAIANARLSKALQKRIAEVEAGAKPKIERYQWKANKEGGQVIGNKETIQPLTKELFDNWVRPKVMDKFKTWEAYEKAHPNSYISLIERGDGSQIVGGVGSLESLRPVEDSLKSGWALPVESFSSKEAKEHSRKTDAETTAKAPIGKALTDKELDRLYELQKKNAAREEMDEDESAELTELEQRFEATTTIPKEEQIPSAPESFDLKTMEPEKIFPTPKKTVQAKNLAGKEVLPQPEADARVKSWKQEALRIGQEEDHSNEVIISLFDRSGKWSEPYEKAGFHVVRFDLAKGQDILENFPVSLIRDLRAAGKRIVGVLAAPPCTSYSVSGARWWATQHDKASQLMVEKKYGYQASKYFDTPLEYANALVAAVDHVVELSNPEWFHTLENPVGRIAEQNKLPKPLLSFDPHNFGDPYTKKTLLWGSFNPELPTANVKPTKGSFIAELRGDVPEQKEARSLTPEGFAYSFFMANHGAEKGGRAVEAPKKPTPVAPAAESTKAQLQKAWKDFDETGDIETAGDLVNKVEQIARKSDEPMIEIERAVEDYRQEEADNRALGGRGDMDAAEAKFIEELHKAMSAPEEAAAPEPVAAVPEKPTVAQKLTQKQLSQIWQKFEKGKLKDFDDLVDAVDEYLLSLERFDEPVPPGLREAVTEYKREPTVKTIERAVAKIGKEELKKRAQVEEERLRQEGMGGDALPTIAMEIAAQDAAGKRETMLHEAAFQSVLMRAMGVEVSPLPKAPVAKPPPPGAKTPPSVAPKAESVAGKKIERGWKVRVRYLDNPAGPLKGTEEVWIEDKPTKGQSGIGAFGRYVVEAVSRERPTRESPTVEPSKPTEAAPIEAKPPEPVSKPEAPVERTKSEAEIRKVAEPYLSEPVQDVTNERARLKLLQQKRDTLNKEYATLDAQYKALAQKVTLTRGPSWKRGRIKQSAKRGDIAEYRDVEAKMNSLRQQMHQLDELGREDQKAVDRAIDAEIISDPKKSLLRRLDRKVRFLEGKAPKELVDALRAESRRVILEKYPDATAEEIARLQPEVERASYFNDDPWKDQNIPDLNFLRLQSLDAALNKPDVPAHQFPEELMDKIRRFSAARRTYGGKVDPNAPVEPLSAKDLSSLKREIETTTKKIHAENAAEAARKAQEEIERNAREAEELEKAQRVADSAEKPGKPGGRSAKAVKEDMVNGIENAMADLVDEQRVKLTRSEEGAYSAESATGVAFGEIEATEGKFKVTVNKAGDKESFSATVPTIEQAQLIIKAMAADGPGHAIFGVPGDGVLKIVNSGKNLLRVWRDARSIQTGPGGGPAPYETRGVSRAQGKEYLAEAKKLAEEGKKRKKGQPLGITPSAPEWLKDLARRAGRKIEILRNQIPARLRSRPTRHIMDQTADALENEARVYGDQMAHRVRVGGVTEMEDMAAAAVIAAKYDPTNLPALLAMARKGKNAKAIDAINYALSHWPRAEQIATRGKQIFDYQINSENIMGINTLYKENYLPGVYDKDLWMGHGRPYMIGGGGGSSTAFKKGKTYESPFHAIADGYVPTSLRLSDMVQHRVTEGQRLMNRIAWGDSLRRYKDPTDGRPIVTSLVVKKRGEGLPGYEVAPIGYTPREIIPGSRIAVHEDYAKLFDALLATSRVPSFEPLGLPVGTAALETEGFLKGAFLLIDTFHLARMAQKQASISGIRSVFQKRMGLTLLEYTNRDLAEAVRSGEITQTMADFAKGNRRKFNLAMRTGLNVGRIQENMYNSVWKALPGFGHFNKFVFERFTRGAMVEAWIHAFDKVRNDHPDLTEMQAAFRVSRDMNQIFGNLGKQGVFKDPTFIDLSRLVALAPIWVEALARTEIRGTKQALIDPAIAKEIPFIQARGILGRSFRNGLVAYFVGTQLLNLITRGKFTWQNEEKGHKLDAWIPGGQNGFFISPLSVFAELTHDLLRYSYTEPDVASALVRIARNKLSPLGRAGDVLVTGRDWDNEKVIGSWERVKRAAVALAPIPITASGPIRAATGTPRYPGESQRQLIGSLTGIKTEPAQSAAMRMSEMARDWLKGGPPKLRARYERELKQEFGPSDYKGLRMALLKKDYNQAREQLDKLLETKSTADIYRTMRPLNREGKPKPFTGANLTEKYFLQSMTPQERELYNDAVRERIELYQRFKEMLKQSTPKNN